MFGAIRPSELSEPSECIGEDRQVSEVIESVDISANSYFEVLGEKPPTKKLTEVN